MAKCKFCGETNSAGTVVCPWCGRRDEEAAQAAKDAAAAAKKKAAEQKEAAEKARRRAEREKNSVGTKAIKYMDRRRFLQIYSKLIRDNKHTGAQGSVVLWLIVIAVALPFLALLLLFLQS